MVRPRTINPKGEVRKLPTGLPVKATLDLEIEEAKSKVIGGQVVRGSRAL